MPELQTHNQEGENVLVRDVTEMLLSRIDPLLIEELIADLDDAEMPQCIPSFEALEGALIGILRLWARDLRSAHEKAGLAVPAELSQDLPTTVQASLGGASIMHAKTAILTHAEAYAQTLHRIAQQLLSILTEKASPLLAENGVQRLGSEHVLVDIAAREGFLGAKAQQAYMKHLAGAATDIAQEMQQDVAPVAEQGTKFILGGKQYSPAELLQELSKNPAMTLAEKEAILSSVSHSLESSPTVGADQQEPSALRETLEDLWVLVLGYCALDEVRLYKNDVRSCLCIKRCVKAGMDDAALFEPVIHPLDPDFFEYDLTVKIAEQKAPSAPTAPVAAVIAAPSPQEEMQSAHLKHPQRLSTRMRRAFRTRFRNIAAHHDDLPAFDAAYIVVAFLIAAIFNLGAFAVLILVHMWLDLLKYRFIHELSWGDTLRGMLRESLLDIFLLLLGLAAAVYLHQAAFAATASGLLRAEVTFVRAAGLLATRMGIFYHFLTVLRHFHEHFSRVRRNPHKDWTLGEQWVFAGMTLTVIALLVAPYVLYMPWTAWQSIMALQLVPWRV